jgi:hypothetical protein
MNHRENTLHAPHPKPAKRHMRTRFRFFAPALISALLALPLLAHAEAAYLEITLKVDAKDRPAAGAVYTQFKQPFLKTVPGAQAKDLLVRDDDVQVLHRFGSRKQAEAYLTSEMFNKDVVVGLKPLLKAAPDIRIYTAQ